MTDIPATGGRWIRDPKTGALSAPADPGQTPAPAQEVEELAPAEPTKPAPMRKGAK